jgi:uncharacterized protein YndB with AHSA1/START domain
MPATTREVVSVYHAAWTSGKWREAAVLLDPNLQVEVPINEYPTARSFVEALISFGSQVQSVEVLSTLSAGGEAMMLYDLDVANLGRLRVAEHFTVTGGKIVRLRQIHDTIAFRPPGHEGPKAPETSYTSELRIDAPRSEVFTALTTPDGLTGWWSTSAEGSCAEGQTMVVGFAGVDETISFRTDGNVESARLVWTCIQHTGLPDWEGTEILFTLSPAGECGTKVNFIHRGLVPALECFDQCRRGWDSFLSSLVSFVEDGRGAPFGSQQ